MSRGGRGRGGARGGGLRNPWQYDDLNIDSRPSELFPPYKVPVAKPPTEQEKREVTYYVELRDQIHQGPLYTKTKPRDPTNPPRIYGEDQENEQYSRKSKADVDPFTGVPTYSMKYEQKERAIPKLSGRSFNKELFPKELWSTLEGEEGEAVRNTINSAMRKRAMNLSRDQEVGDLGSEEKTQSLLQKLKHVPEEDDGDMDLDRDEGDMIEDEDYDYEDDEAEMGADYNGERYFETGEDDDDGDGDGGVDDFA